MIDSYPQSAPMNSMGCNALTPMKQYTVAENIDRKIAEHKEAITRLEELRVKLQTSLLDVSISDLRDAMNY